jgi:hypothetical protein
MNFTFYCILKTSLPNATNVRQDCFPLPQIGLSVLDGKQTLSIITGFSKTLLIKVVLGFLNLCKFKVTLRPLFTVKKIFPYPLLYICHIFV